MWGDGGGDEEGVGEVGGAVFLCGGGVGGGGGVEEVAGEDIGVVGGFMWGGETGGGVGWCIHSDWRLVMLWIEDTPGRSWRFIRRM